MADMFPLSFAEFQQLTHCSPVARTPPDCHVIGAAIDSRSIQAGSVFVALPGESHHGLDFAAEAWSSGCSVILTATECYERLSAAAKSALSSYPIALVEDPVAALQAFAAWNRRQSSAEVIAVTGSVGKTTTRGLIASVQRQAGSVLESPRNYNNHLGVPLTLLQLAPEHRVCVVEIGSSATGEIDALAALAQPTHAVITRIGAAHLEGLTSIDVVAREKLSLLKHVLVGGTAWLNGDDAYLQAAADQMTHCDATHPIAIKVVSAGNARPSNADVPPTWNALDVNGTRFTAPLAGRHNGFAIRTAVELGMHFDLTDEQIQMGLEVYRPQPGRCQVIETCFGQLIDDTYNASPSSVEAAIDLLSHWPNADSRILVLGDMLELGVHAQDIHAKVGADICDSNIDQVWLTGTATRTTADVIRTSCSRKITVRWHASGSDIGRELRQQLFASLPRNRSTPATSPGTRSVILVKGSRGMRMEQVVDALRAEKH